MSRSAVISTLETFDEDELESLRDILLERRRLMSKDGLAFYRPHKKQDWFHRAGAFKFRYLRTGNRFGKSDCGTAEDVAWSIGERPWYPEDDEGRYIGIPRKATRGLILCTDWQKAKEVFTDESEGPTQGKLWKFIPKRSFVRRNVDHSGHINQIIVKSKWGGQSSIYIDTVAGFKLNEQRGESSWYDWIHVDEPIPEAMWNAYARGLIDYDGSAWFTCTPIAQPWINKFFLPAARYAVDDTKLNLFSKREDGKPDRVVIVGSSFDNPFTSKDAAETFASTLSDREKAARLYGRPIDQSGAVHPDFETTSHVYIKPPPGWKDVNTPPLDYTIRVAIDPHPHTPHAVLWAATAPNGQVYFYNEVFEACDARALGEQIAAKIDGYFCPVIWMDPSGFTETMRDKSSFADDLVEFGIYPEKASKDLKRGILMTNVALRKQGFLNFAYNLERTLGEFDMYVYQDPLKRPDKPVDRDDHMMENLHRLVLGGLSYISPEIYDAEVRNIPQHSLLTL